MFYQPQIFFCNMYVLGTNFPDYLLKENTEIFICVGEPLDSKIWPRQKFWRFGHI